MRKGPKQKIKLTPAKPAPPAGEVFDFAPAKPKTEPPPPPPEVTPKKSWPEWVWFAGLGLAAIVVFVNTLGGEFVYDDRRQIVRNALIQDLNYFFRALASDVWAFKSEAVGAASSNYWRPSFVFWMIANFQLFGLNAAGWHAGNILMHAGVTVLAYFLLRKFELSRLAAAAVALLFAVHPVHTESVAWISGAPDVIMSLGVLGSLWFVRKLQTQPTPRNWLLALALAAVALGAKEAAILYPLVVFALLWQPRGAVGAGLDWRGAARWAAPFAVLSFVYFLLRLAVIGQVGITSEDAPTKFEMLLSAPEIFAFYLRQCVFPLRIGPAYPLRAVTSLGVANFFVPLAVSLAAGVGLLWLARRSALGRLGVAMFLFFLAPAFNIAAFPREQAVHDRYLYLSLLGLLIAVVPPLVEWAEQRGREVVVCAAVGAACLALGAQTWRYNRAWLSNLALHQAAVKSDPTAALNHDNLAAELVALKRYDEALVSYNQAVALNPRGTSFVGRAEALTELQRYDEAERDLREVTNNRARAISAYGLYQGYERLAVCYERQKKLEQAVQALTEARDKLPQYRAALTEKMSIILYQAGKQDVALSQLEAVRANARAELLPESKLVLFRLGLLYQGFNKPAEARAALREYVTLTADMQDPTTKQYRPQAMEALRKLGG
jgi:tetratricopeptide (TPR) repeat protein